MMELAIACRIVIRYIMIWKSSPTSLSQDIKQSELLSIFITFLNDFLLLRSDEMATISFKWKDIESTPTVKYLLFTAKDFWSQLGGLIGLFAGISVLSIVETIYFFTLRLFLKPVGR